MAQKINPILFRITNGNRLFTWSSDWFCGKNSEYARLVIEDLKIHAYFKRVSFADHVASIKIERKSEQPHIFVKSARSSLLLGKKGKSLDLVVSELLRLIGKKVRISVVDVKRADLNANIVAKAIAERIAKRVAYKKAAKTALDSVMRAGATGVKIMVSGRLNGSEIARSESFKLGSMPLHSIRANINYAFTEAKTTYGIIGVKLWMHLPSVVRRH